MNRSAAIALAIVGFAAAAPAQVLYTTSFEANDKDGNYVAGEALNGQPGGSANWITLSGTAIVEASATAPAGANQVSLNDGAQIDRDLTALAIPNGRVVWVEGWFRGEGSAVTLANANYPTSEAGTQASAIIHFSRDNGIEMLNGDGAGGAGAIVPAGIPLGVVNSSNWYRVTLKLDFTAKQWDAYINGVKVNASPLGFRDDVSTLRGFRNLAEAQAYFDGFRVVLPMTGDANGDNETDSADLVSMIDYTVYDPATYDPILVANVAAAGQTDGQGRLIVTAEDVVALGDLIINN